MRHGDSNYTDFTLEDYVYWAERGFCVVCQTEIVWQDDADDFGCLCTNGENDAD